MNVEIPNLSTGNIPPKQPKRPPSPWDLHILLLASFRVSPGSSEFQPGPGELNPSFLRYVAEGAGRPKVGGRNSPALSFVRSEDFLEDLKVARGI